ncbi:kinase-like domain-containing protein [Ampelomyces quisqualis]|uniref:non-specific serine/threonine protein kinase n=1 Tax=Ampelomyces quisqualis TaxID=50730 RepID=A0A6A5QQK6_AMPQU|nr:kinase-like domain-containing protein [Ampelomyces quisqualis]
MKSLPRERVYADQLYFEYPPFPGHYITTVGKPVASYRSWCFAKKYDPKSYDSIYIYLSGITLLQHTNDPHGFPGAYHAASLITSGRENINTAMRCDRENIQRALNRVYADQHIGHNFDAGEMIGCRWQITARLSNAQGFFNRGIHTVKDMWQALDKACVVKVLPSEGMYSGYARREIAAMFLLKGHPNIVSIRDADLPDHQHLAPWLVMDFCNAGTLQQCIWNNVHRRMPELFVWHVFESLVEAIRHCQYGPTGGNPNDWETIFHRDIIPGNILLDRAPNGESSYPTVKLADFGCAVTDSEMKNCGLTISDLPEEDPDAIPPEGPVASQAADIYQIGRVIETLILSKEPSIGRGKADTHYTYDLRINVQLCKLSEPLERPTVEELLNVIRNRKDHLLSTGEIKYEDLIL